MEPVTNLPPDMDADAAELMADMARDTPDAPSATVVAEGSLDVVLGMGEPIRLGDKTYNVAPFTFRNIAVAGALISQMPELLLMHAVAARKSRVFDCSATADVINEVRHRMHAALPAPAEGEEQIPLPATVTADQVEVSLGNVGMRMSEAEAQACVDLLHLCLSRHNPEIKKEEIDEHLNIPMMLSALVSLIDVNPSLADRV